MAQLHKQSDLNKGTEGQLFYPRGFIVIAFTRAEDAQQAVERLQDGGLPSDDLTIVDPESMRQQAAENLEHPSIFAAMGSSVKVRQEQFELASSGCTFVLIDATRDGAEEQAVRAMSGMPLAYAVIYRALVIENLRALIATGDSNNDRIEAS